MEKRISRKTVYTGRIINVHRDTVEISGRRVIRDLITHPGSAVIIPVLSLKPPVILMVDQYRYAAGKRLLELPAGTRGAKESSLTCAQREIREETGYKAGKIKKLLGLYPSPGVMTEYMDIFAAYGLKKAPLKRDFDEDIRVVPVPLSRAVSMALKGKIADAKSIAGILAFNALLKQA